MTTEAQASGLGPVFGVFVGGRGTRLGGVVKGALRAPSGGTILERLFEVVQRGCPGASVVLVGETPLAAALPRLSDSPAARGPLGGLVALLRYAGAQGRAAVALASDLPSVSPALIRRVSSEHPEATLYAPRIDGIWQPLFARYAPESLLPIVDEVLRSPHPRLLALLDRAPTWEMLIDEAELRALTDWDEPTDLPPELRHQLPGHQPPGPQRSRKDE